VGRKKINKPPEDWRKIHRHDGKVKFSLPLKSRKGSKQLKTLRGRPAQGWAHPAVVTPSSLGGDAAKETGGKKHCGKILGQRKEDGGGSFMKKNFGGYL